MLSDIRILPGYETRINDIGNEFYNPVLTDSIEYDRLVGYFSSKSLAFFSKGIESLINKKGHYRLLISNIISEADFEAIKSGYKYRGVIDKLGNQLHGVMEPEPDFLSEWKDLGNLAYLISIGVVDVKIGFTKEGLFHAKIGIMTDEAGNQVYFSGSLNETENAFKHNYESIDVKKSWTDIDTSRYIALQQESFNRLWNGQNDDEMIFVKEIDELLNEQIAKYDNGKIIMDENILTPNSLVLYVSEGSLKIQNNLDSKTNEALNTSPSSRQIRRIESKYLVDGKHWEFKKNIPYNEFQNIIKFFSKASESNEKPFNFVVSDSVYDFIKESEYKIDKLSLLGLDIKDKNQKFNLQLEKFKSIVDEETVRPLREAQLWVSYYMAIMKRVGNFSVPGAGKTAMVYGTYAYLSSEKINVVDQIVVIGPKSSFLAWKDEFESVFGEKRNLNVLDVQASDFREQDIYKNTSQYDLILVNYEALQKYETPLSHIISKRTLLVFDEVHKVKGVEAKTPRAVQVLANKADYKLALTGTPLPNGYVDIFNMLHFLYPDEYKDYFGFSTSELTNADVVTSAEINKKLNPFFWRVTKNELDVPEAEPDNIIKLRATAQEQEVIDILWRKYGHQPFKLYIRLIQMASNPSLLEKSINESQFQNADAEDGPDFEFNKKMMDQPDFTAEELTSIHNLKKSSKFESAVNKAIELIELGEKPIVWAIFVDTIDKFAKQIESQGYKVAKIYGQVPSSEREQIIKGFQNGEYDLLVSNPHTLAESVSLHHISHAALYLEYSFNLTHMLQSRDRIHRLGLDKNTKTNYYYFELVGDEGSRQPIDEKIYNRLDEKKQLMFDVIEGQVLRPEFSENQQLEIEELMNEFIGETK
ncbi:SNF2-related protein [Weissella viridescens]